MFIWTAKINRKKIAVVMAAGVVVAAAAMAAVMWTARPASAAVANPKGVRSAEDRTAYLQAWGWQVASEPTLVEELAMPKEFGEEYSQYLELQSAQGFDLTKYAGKRIKRYTYDVLNYPNGDTGVIAHLLIYKNTVIGGEIMGDSFLHGLQVPQ